MDNPFDTPISGQADWDSGLSANFQVINRGYHVTERAGQDISSGQVLTLNSGGFFFPYNPNSADVQPHAYAYTAALSGESVSAVAWGIVRSLDINSPCVPGQLMFSNGSGFLDVATLGIPVGVGLDGRGVLFKPFLPAVAGGGGVTMIQSLSDVDITGLGNDSILKWSNTSSKFVMAVDSAGGGGPASGRAWRIRLICPLDSHKTDGAGFCLVDWKDSGGISLVGSGTPFASVTDTAGGWAAAEAFNGSSASGNGWFAGTAMQNLSWLAYDFGSSVQPATVEFAPLTGFVWAIGLTLAIDYSSDKVVWKTLCLIDPAAGADNTVQTFTLPDKG